MKDYSSRTTNPKVVYLKRPYVYNVDVVIAYRQNGSILEKGGKDTRTVEK